MNIKTISLASVGASLAIIIYLMVSCETGSDSYYEFEDFSSEDININSSSRVYKYFLENFDEEKEKKINAYLESFYSDNFLKN